MWDASLYGGVAPNNVCTKLLLDAARERGITVEPLTQVNMYRLILGDHEEFVASQWTSQMTHAAYRFTELKHVTKEFLSRAGVSVPDGIRTRNRAEVASWIEGVEGPIVLKPESGSKGKGVRIGLKGPQEVLYAFEDALSQSRKAVLLEKFVEGTEYRVFASRNRFIAAANRIPANVTGDGRQTIAELAEERNVLEKRGTPGQAYDKPLFRIEMDSVVLAFLQEKGMTPETVPHAGEQVFLRENTNVSTGGDSIDMTDEVHADVRRIAVEAVRAIPGLPFAGVDFISKDIRAPQTSDMYAIVELNPSPGISLHHFPVLGRARNVAGVLIEELFPEVAV